MASEGERLFCLVLGTVVIIVLVLVSSDVREFTKIFPKSNICITAQCMKVNNILKSFVDKTKDPCQDFEQFVCNIYLERKAKEGMSGDAVVDANTDHTKELTQMLRKPIGHQDRLIERLAKQFHKSCMNKESINSKGFNFIKNQILKMPKIPLLDSTFSTENFTWINYYKSALNLGIEVYTIVIMTFTTIRGNERDLILNMRMGLLEKLSNKDRDGRKKLVLEYFQENGVNTTKETEKEVDKALDFHNELADFMNHQIVITSGKMPIALLKKSCPDVDWLALANIFYDEDHKLNENDFIDMEDERAICELQKILEKRKREFANHLFISVIVTLRALLQQFQKAANENSTESMSKTCTSLENSNFPVGPSLLFMLNKNDEYGEGVRKEFNRLVSKEVREELKIMVGNEATWISKYVREKLSEKIESVVTHLGFLRSNETISQQIHEYEDVYKNISFLDDDPIHNCLQVIKARNAAASKTKIFTFVIRVLHGNVLANVIEPGAWFVPNSLEIAYGMLFPLTYQHLGPASHNYGGIGYIAGHEFGHSLDPTNFIFNASAVVSDFWDKRGEMEYKRRTRCLVKEYNKAFDNCTNDYVDGEFTLGENFADLVGMTVARRLLSKWLKKNGGVDLKLKDFSEYSPEQMFWIAASAFYCQRRHFIECMFGGKDRHTRGPVRINMNAKMSPYFAKDWKCNSGPMNPETKCKIF